MGTDPIGGQEEHGVPTGSSIGVGLGVFQGSRYEIFEASKFRSSKREPSMPLEGCKVTAGQVCWQDRLDGDKNVPAPSGR